MFVIVARVSIIAVLVMYMAVAWAVAAETLNPIGGCVTLIGMFGAMLTATWGAADAIITRCYAPPSGVPTHRRVFLALLIVCGLAVFMGFRL
jgi:hypothetical protein